MSPSALRLILLLGALAFPALVHAQGDTAGKIDRAAWADDGSAFFFTDAAKKRWRVDLETLEKTAVGDGDEGATSRARRARSWNGGRGARTGKNVGGPRRGRQYTRCDSPDGKWKAKYQDWNVVLEGENGESVQVTRDGNETIHYGTASWVYGEELDQNTAMWWTPDSKKLLFYRFDDTGVQPFHLVTGWSKVITDHYPEFYPKAGDRNPAAELMIYDLASQKMTRVDLDGSSDTYTYGIRCAADGETMLLNWTDRLQRHLIVYAIDLETGALRKVVEEKQPCFQENSPPMRWLEDKKRFVWPSDATGFTHYQLRNLDGTLESTITSGDFQTANIHFLDEEAGLMGLSAYSSAANPYFLQFHVAKLDGSGMTRVTTRDLHHSRFMISPDRKWLVAQYEATNTPPCTAIYAMDGSRSAVIAEAAADSAANLAEMFKFRSKDDDFDVYGILYKPKDFDPKKSYPMLNTLYAGPGSNELGASYVSSPRGETRQGYLVVRVNNRGTGRRGKAFLTATYGRLGDVDIQDHADAVRMLRERPYVDGKRVGIVGHSFGGYMAAMGAVKHADVYRAAVNRAGVTDWRNYDTIYTERYMSTPQLNSKGYDIGRATRKDYIRKYKKNGGRMLIMHGMVDDNVHPNNAFQLTEALDKAKADYELRIFPNGGHGLGARMMEWQTEFFQRMLRPDEN
jgi:dipeptidyl-peptidase 4